MKINKFIFLILIVILVILSIFPRVTEVVNGNYVFGFDQGRDYLDVQKIVDKHKFTLIGTEIGAGNAGLQYIFHGPGYYYLLAIPYLLFRGDPYGGVVLMFILGIFSIALAFFSGYQMWGKWGGLLFALLIAISPPLVGQSRFIWNSFPATPIIILVYYFVFKSLTNKKFIFLAGFFSAFIYNFELAMAVPLVLSILLFSLLILKLKKLRDYLLLVLCIMLGFLPMMLFEIRHGFLGFKSILNYIFTPHGGSGGILNFIYNPSHINSFLFNFRDGFPLINNIVLEIVLFIVMLIAFIWVYKIDKDGHLKKFFLSLLALPFITYFILAFLRNAVWPHYLNHLLIGYLFLFTFVTYKSVQHNLWLKYILAIYLVLFLYRGVLNAYTTFFQDFANYYGGTAKVKGKTDALDYIYKDANGKNFGLFIFSPPIYTYPFDYLLNWYALKKYHYLPTTEKKGLFYLLIEKDEAQPWRDKGWQETVINSGKILDKKTLKPSNFIIQKRYQE